MTITRYDFEGGSNGANMTTGSGVIAVSAGPMEYSNADEFHDALGVVSVSGQWAKWDSPNPGGDHSGSIYVRAKVNNGTGSQRVVMFDNAGTGDGGAISFHSNGLLRIVSTTNTLVDESSTTWVAGDEFRLDWQYNDTGADATLDVRIYKGGNIEGSTPDEVLSGTITGGACAVVRIGGTTSGAWEFAFDDLALSNVLEWIGPYAGDTPLATPVLTLVSQTDPSTVGASNGDATVSWPAVAGTDHYAAAIAGGLDQTSGFTIVNSNATSPYTFTGLSDADYTLAVRAVP